MKKLFCIALILLLLYPTVVDARTVHYVCDSATAASTTPPQSGGKTGTDWANCWDYVDVFRSTAKWCTATPTGPKTGCADLIGPGDTVYIDGGTEGGGGITYLPAAGYNAIRTYGDGYSTAYPITITLDPTQRNYRVILDGQRNASWASLVSINHAYITLDGHIGSDTTRRIIVKNSYTLGLYMQGSGGTAKSGQKVTYLEIYNHENHPSGIYGNVQIAGTTNYPDPNNPTEISYCYIHDPYTTTNRICIGGTNDGLSCTTCSPYADCPGGSCSVRGKNVRIGSAGSQPTAYGSYKIHHNVFENADGDHLEIAGGSVDMYDNTFWNASNVCVYDVVHAFATYIRMWNNTFYGVTGESLYAEQKVYVGDDMNAFGYIVFMNNLLYYTSSGYLSLPLHGKLLPGFIEDSATGLHHVYIINNTFVIGGRNVSLSISKNATSSSVDNIFIVNNVFKDTPVGILLIDDAHGNGTVTWGGWLSGANVVVDNNVAYASSGSYTTESYFDGTYYSWPNLKGVCTNGVVTCNQNDQGSPIDPKLTALYTLQSDSPAIDKGIDMSAYSHLSVNGGPCSGGCKDKAGVSRPQGSAWDIGAYEYSSSTSWGHSVSATEPTKLTFSDTWTCSTGGTTCISGSGDEEKITLAVGEYAYTTNCSYVGANKKITLKQSYYRAGENVTVKYRTGTSNDICKAASWSAGNTASSFSFWMPAGDTYIGVRVEK